MVSIIIPAYNVERYIEKCVTTCLMQTYSNIEVIVINDGSTDNTAKILDELGSKNDRLKVTHTKNAGVSSARNTGLDIATGEWVVFVDGDDYIADNYIEYMLSLVENNQAEFGLSKNAFVKKDEEQTKDETITMLSKEDAIALLLSPRVIVGCWNKIYKRELLLKNNIKFSKDLFYGEGLQFITTVAFFANKVAVGDRKVYYYRRNNLQSATTHFNIEKFFNGEESLKRIKNGITLKSKKIDIMYQLHLCTFYLSALVKIRAQKMRKTYKSNYKCWLKYIRKNTIKLIGSKYVSLYRKLLLVAGCISPWLIMKLDIVRQRRKIAQSI